LVRTGWLVRRCVGGIRGKKENIGLESSYSRLYEGGTQYVSKKIFQRRLTTKKLKISDKTANVAGLQLADLIANPSMRSMVCAKTDTPMTAEFGRRVVEILERHKYRRKSGVIAGSARSGCPKKKNRPSVGDRATFRSSSMFPWIGYIITLIAAHLNRLITLGIKRLTLPL